MTMLLTILLVMIIEGKIMSNIDVIYQRCNLEYQISEFKKK